MNIEKMVRYNQMLENENLSEEERVVIVLKLIRENNKGDLSFKLLIMFTFLSPVLLLFLNK